MENEENRIDYLEDERVEEYEPTVELSHEDLEKASGGTDSAYSQRKTPGVY